MAIPNDQYTSWDSGTFVSVADTFDSWRKKTNGLKVDIGTQITNHVGAATGAHVASAISSTPFGSGAIAAINVQDALNEIWSESARSDHTHGNITLAGKIKDNSLPNKPLITTTGGDITVGSFGTTQSSFCEGNDARLSLSLIHISEPTRPY